MLKITPNPSHLEVIYHSLEELGTLDIYELLSGRTTDYNITYPAFYITNITNSSVNATIIAQTIESYIPILENTIFTKDPFVGGVVAFSFVLCGIVTATWMILILLIFSSNSVPNSLLLVTLYSCCTYTVVVSRLTEILKYQIASNFTNIDEINSMITFSKDISVVRTILFLLIYVSWVDLVVQMNKIHNRRKALIMGLSIAVVTFAINTAYNILAAAMDTETKAQSRLFHVFKYIHWTSDYLVMIFFVLEVMIYAKQRLKFVFHTKVLPMTIFCLITLLTPFVFLSLDISSTLLKNWANYIFSFSKLCCSIVVWEWLHSVRTLEVKYEKKTIIGRKISNDSFARDSRYKPFGSKSNKRSNTIAINQENLSSTSVSNYYILKSTNFLSFVDGLCKAQVWVSDNLKKFVLRRHTSFPNQASGDDVSLFEMTSLNPQMTNLTNITQDTIDGEDGISYIEDNHPLFEIDHRYLRNTPSTIAPNSARNTPVHDHDQVDA